MNYDYEMIHLIIIAAVRKGYKWAAIHLQDPHVR